VRGEMGKQLGGATAKKLVDEMGLNAGDEVNLVQAADRMLSIEKDRRRGQALERLASMRLTLPRGYKFGRGEANER
jgi:antitoxin MazE